MSELLFKDKKKKTYTKKLNGKIKTTIDNRHNQKLHACTFSSLGIDFSCCNDQTISLHQRQKFSDASTRWSVL